MKTWTLGQRILSGFAVVVLLATGCCVIGALALRSVVANKDRVIMGSSHALALTEHLSGSVEHLMAVARSYLLTGEAKYFDQTKESYLKAQEAFASLQPYTNTPEAKELIATSEHYLNEYWTVLQRIMGQRQVGLTAEALTRAFDVDLGPKRDAMTDSIARFEGLRRTMLEADVQTSSETANSAVAWLSVMAAVMLCAGGGVGWLITRVLVAQVGLAIQQIQSSSAELQAAATQQATGSKEQASAATQVSTTMRELLTTSRQISEGAQQVVRIAESTATTARSGESVVTGAQMAIASIKQQVDLVVAHMLELGRKSQQIGGILEIINELSEQTNILAINATIESAGAGDAGKRFAVVADEIRKLADRVGSSTKEIRTLIEEVRAASNTTVMATEQGAKSVDTGARQFTEVTQLFQQIASLVVNTTEAAREIELSTKQQTTAVEQVNTGIANVAQTTKETETSTRQTMQTSAQLSGLSRELTRLIRAGGEAA